MTRFQGPRAALPMALALALSACGVKPAATIQAPAQAAGTATEADLNAPQAQFGLAPSAAPTAAPTPAPTAVPASAAPSASPSPAGPAAWTPGGAGPYLAFASSRQTGGAGGFDVFLYDAGKQTVLAVPGINTGADELNPRISSNGRYLVYSTNVNGNFDVRRFDFQSQTIDTLATLNTGADELSPSVDDAGDRLAFAARTSTGWELRLYDVNGAKTTVPAPINHADLRISRPEISADGNQVVFTGVDGRNNADVYTYQVGGTTITTPPFIDSPGAEDDGCLSADGTKMLFDSNLGGQVDIFEADLVTGNLDRLALANSAGTDSAPRYVGADILFQSDRDGTDRLYLYHPGSGLLDTLPLLHEAGEDDLLNDTTAGGGTASGGGFFDEGGGFSRGRFGGLFGGL